MAVLNTAPVTEKIEYTDISDPNNHREVSLIATFNGKIYNGKRYINIAKRTLVWQDGFGWADKRDGRYAFSDLVVEAFGLK